MAVESTNLQYACGWAIGTGAAQNVVLGWIPDDVRVINYTDGDRIDDWSRGRVMPFTSGGTQTLAAGDTIKGDTSGATAIVKQVLLGSGTFAGGDAAGYIIFDQIDKVGTFGSENVSVTAGSAAFSNIATVTVDVEMAVATTTAVASATSNVISSYVGVAGPGGTPKGFTIGSTTSETGDLLRWQAWRDI
jgi:hypothetical protein